MFVPKEYISPFSELVKAISGINLEKIDNPNQPDYKWSWRGEFFWAYENNDGLETYATGKLKDLEEIWTQCLRDAAEEYEKGESVE